MTEVGQQLRRFPISAVPCSLAFGTRLQLTDTMMRIGVASVQAKN